MFHKLVVSLIPLMQQSMSVQRTLLFPFHHKTTSHLLWCSLCIHAFGADSHAWGVAFSENEGVHKAHNQRSERLQHPNIQQGDVVWITARYNESRTLSVSFCVNEEPELCCWSDSAMQNLTLFPSLTLGPPATFTII
ncbi:hypothetical protein Pelo_1264 [Pelomyxa schiedti]|nr:hypothetical protein Pelo_1264 [Pelomyxa schiedti]